MRQRNYEQVEKVDMTVKRLNSNVCYQEYIICTLRVTYLHDNLHEISTCTCTSRFWNVKGAVMLT